MLVDSLAGIYQNISTDFSNGVLITKLWFAQWDKTRTDFKIFPRENWKNGNKSAKLGARRRKSWIQKENYLKISPTNSLSWRMYKKNCSSMEKLKSNHNEIHPYLHFLVVHVNLKQTNKKLEKKCWCTPFKWH